MRRTVTDLLGAALITVVLVSCSNSPSTAKSASTASTTSTITGSTLPPLSTTAPGDPDRTPNPIPFNVGEIAARSHGWRVGVTSVIRPLREAGLPALPAGQEYVGVDVTMINDGTATVRVNARAIFSLTDATGHAHRVVSGAQGATGLDGSYSPGTTRAGRMIFAAPAGQDLLMLLDGPTIHTQLTVFQIDPPTHPAID